MLKGIILSLSASVLFGYLYYFSTLLQPLGGEDIFGFRILFTLPFVIASIFLFKQTAALRHYLQRVKQQPLILFGFLFNSAMMGIQMWLFLWAPNNGSALSVSFGYLLLPLTMVLVGHVVFKEHISKMKLLAVIIAAVGVFSNIALKGGLSWESLLVCFGYSTYFATRKILKLNDFASFCIEMTLLLPVCLYFATKVDLHAIQQVNPPILWLLLLLGLISGIALTTYIVASSLLPINVLGLLGYVEPVMMLAVSFLIGEQLDSETLPLFICLMISMLLFMSEGIIRLKRRYQ